MDEIIVCQCAIRRYLDKQKLFKREKKRKYRDNVAKEIVETEEHYVNCLRTLVDVILHTLEYIHLFITSKIGLL